MKILRYLLFTSLFLFSVTTVSAESVSDSGQIATAPTPITVSVLDKSSDDESSSLASLAIVSPTQTPSQPDHLESGLTSVTLVFTGVLSLLLLLGWGMIYGIKI